MSPLSVGQEPILRFIAEHVEAHGYGPTYQEIVRARGLSYTRMRQQIEELIRKGYLARGPKYTARSLRVLVQPQAKEAA